MSTISTNEAAQSGPQALVGVPAYQRFDCSGCAACCSGIFTITLTPQECERLSAQGWEDEPALRDLSLFVRHGKTHRLNTRADGACVFLDDARRCRIHAKFGEEAKPLACRLYPFKLIPTDDAARVDCRFDCPAIAANTGRQLIAHRPALTALLPDVLPHASMLTPVLTPDEGNVISWAQASRVAGACVRLLGHTALDVTERVAGCVLLAGMLQHLRLDALNRATEDKVLGALHATVLAEMANEPLVRRALPAAISLAFRQHLAAYARQDHWGKRGQRLRRLRHYGQMLRGVGEVPPARADFPAVTFAALETPLGSPPDAVMAPLLRYYRLRLESLGFFGPAFYGYGVLDGLRALLLTYPLVLWFARAYAVGRELFAPDAACIEAGIRIVDHAHGISPALDLPLDRYRLRYLCKRPVSLRLIAWQGM